jgi:hypothetical protein
MECPLLLRPSRLSLLAAATIIVMNATPTLAESVTLTWAAPGDDSLMGRAARYDLRYSIQPLSSANFGLATAAPNLPSPAPPGSIETVTIAALDPGQTYYFAIRVADDAGNWSTLSRVIQRAVRGVADVVTQPALRFSPPGPNPARAETRFRFELPGPMRVRVAVFDVGGRRVRTLMDESRGAGTGDLAFDLRDEGGSPLAQGIYLVRAQLGGTAITRRLVVAR